mgnify:FL=1
MQDKSAEIINKDLILREKLAVERTNMAIDRTLLSFIRTSLYFAVAGMTVTSLLKTAYSGWIDILFWFISVLILIIGFISFFRQKKRLAANRMHIGNYKLVWDED